MWKIGAPDAAVAEFLDQLARERHRVGVRRALPRGAVGPAHLDPHVAILHQRQQIAERLLLKAARGVDAAHVVDHHRHRRAPERRRQFADPLGCHMDLQMPADIGEPRAELDHLVDRRAFAEMLHVMEAHAAEALRVAPLELGVGDGDRHQRHAQVSAAFGGERVGGGGKVETVRGAMHDHAALDAEKSVPREQRLLRRVGRRVAAPKGKARARPKHMHMGIAGAGRQLQFRLARRRRPGRREGGGVGGVCHERSLTKPARVRSMAGSCLAKAASQAARSASSAARKFRNRSAWQNFLQSSLSTITQSSLLSGTECAHMR